MFDPIVSSYRDKKKKKKERKKEGRGTELSSCPSVSRWRGIVLKERLKRNCFPPDWKHWKKRKIDVSISSVTLSRVTMSKPAVDPRPRRGKREKPGAEELFKTIVDHCFRKPFSLLFFSPDTSSSTVLFKFTFSIDNPWKLSNMWADNVTIWVGRKLITGNREAERIFLDETRCLRINFYSFIG